MYNEITKCRICGNTHLVPIIDLGEQSLTGVFPKSREEKVDVAPLELVRCVGMNSCGLVQLRHSYEPTSMYGNNYGYRSGLNSSMVRHLQEKVVALEKRIDIKDEDLVIDIGSNDSTLLRSYKNKNAVLVGVDPTGIKFKEYYPENIKLIPDFFSKEIITESMGKKKAKIITSIAMFYDLEDPLKFMQDVFDVLDDDGIWHFEQSYMPKMIENVSYDTICHEHLEYYGVKQIYWMTEKIGFRIEDIEFNSINGGSFAVTVSKKKNKNHEEGVARKFIDIEESKGFGGDIPYIEFRKKILEHRDNLINLINCELNEGKIICGYGASTKGNVVLQFCGLTDKEIKCIAEVNVEKFGLYTPGTGIPIVSEQEAKMMNPDYFIVLPWHFRDNILEKEKKHANGKYKFIFPLPIIEVI